MRLLVYHSLLIRQALFVHNNNKKNRETSRKFVKNCKPLVPKKFFFSRIDSCFKNQIAFLLTLLAYSCPHEYKSVNCTDEQRDENY